MKKLAAVLATIAAVAAISALPARAVDHGKARVQELALGTISPSMIIGSLAYSATTTTWANSNHTAILTSDSGTESAPTLGTVGLSLDGLGGVSVILKTSSNATAGGTLQAYVYNVETATWARVPDLDLTAVASTNQSWPALYVPVARGRLYYNPSGIGSVTTTIYLVGQPKPAL